MPRETLGVVKLEWTCPKCGSRNPGPEKTCLSCGAPQPKEVQFQQAEHQELIKEQAEIEKAKIGPDIHCAFCGTRNPANAKVCSQCGAELKEGVRREAGHVVGAFTTGPVKQVACPNCGAQNPASALKCAQCGATLALAPTTTPPAVFAPSAVGKKTNPLAVVAAIILGAVSLAVVVGLFLMVSRTEGVTATVQGVQWVTTVSILRLQPATYQGWIDEIPAEAQIGDCSLQVHHTQDEPAPNSNKICGTPYTVDSGSGYAEVVQDCYYEVLVDYCQYTVMEWQVVDQLQLQGTDFSPRFAEPALAQGEKLGQQTQSFVINFETSEGQYSFTTDNLSEFQRFQIGTEWILTINAFGQVVSVEQIQ